MHANANDAAKRSESLAWVLLDDNFPNHPKAVAVGPLAAYLFVCGLCYCRKYLTDGFIPSKAVATLGAVSNPRKLAEALVKARLWEQIADGFQVHDYQQMYSDENDKATTDARRQQKREAGRKGGRASWAARSASSKTEAGAEAGASACALAESKHSAEASAEAHRSGVVRSGSGSQLLGEKSEEGNPAPELDRWLMQLQEDYPQHRVTYGFMTSQSFFEAFKFDPRPAREVWAEMRANLENQKSGHEWRVKGMVPKLETWLRDGRWKQHHDEAPASELVSEKTSKTLTAAAAVKRMGGR